MPHLELFGGGSLLRQIRIKSDCARLEHTKRHGDDGTVRFIAAGLDPSAPPFDLREDRLKSNWDRAGIEPGESADEPVVTGNYSKRGLTRNAVRCFLGDAEVLQADASGKGGVEALHEIQRGLFRFRVKRECFQKLPE